MSDVNALQAFLLNGKRNGDGCLTAISLFSGAGLSDLGYELAGFRFHVQVEIDESRAELGQANFAHSRWLAKDVRTSVDDIVAAYRESTDLPLSLLAATPPCQGMSSSNPSRGKRHTPEAKRLEEKNSLILSILPIARTLRPRVIVAENVRQILTLHVTEGNEERRAVDVLREGLKEYEVFEGVINVADYGVPQTRKRAVLVAVRRDQVWLERLASAKVLPWPRFTHAPEAKDELLSWVSVRKWFTAMGYGPLDAHASDTAIGKDPLHFVPVYSGDRYLQVSQIPPYSGKSAYQNAKCPECGVDSVPERLAVCPQCGGVLRNRPFVMEKGKARLIKGFHSSYRRMAADQPAATVTTNSSHVGSDYKIHPWENRVLSILECADLQTVPRSYDWSRALAKNRTYLIRQVVGEALPPYFTYLHGLVLRNLLSESKLCEDVLAPALNQK